MNLLNASEMLVIFTAFNTNLGIYDKQYQTLRN